MATPSSTSPETMTSERNSNEDVEKLRSAAMNGDWYSVLDMYREKRELRMAKITKGDTVLHMAVSSGKESLVDDMVDIVCGERTNLQDETSTSLPPVDENGNEKKDVLGAKNDQGNTPLHLAASIGNVRMCKKIGGKDSSLIAERNNAGETPLFLAFFHRHKKAFLWLHYQFMGSPGVVSSTDIAHFIKRDNDDTILHCALEEEHIDVAIEIVLLYKEYLKEMTMMRNKNGLSPLHVLAVSHSAFESTHLPSLPFIGQLFYHFCNLEGTFFRVKKKKQATTKEELEQHERKPCVESIIDALVEYGSNRVDDLEGSCWAVTIGNIIVCSLCVLAVIPLIPPFLAEILIHGVRNLKEKHRWSLQIAEELLQHAPEEDMLANPYGEDGGDAGSEKAATTGSLRHRCRVIQSLPCSISLLQCCHYCVSRHWVSPASADKWSQQGKVWVVAGSGRGEAVSYHCEESMLQFPSFLSPMCCESSLPSRSYDKSGIIGYREEVNQHSSSRHLCCRARVASLDVGIPCCIGGLSGDVEQEMVEKILEYFPHAMEVVNEEGKNIVLLAAEKRQTKLYQILWGNEKLDKSAFSQVDKDGNTALHLAAKLGVNLNWQTTTMVEEFKWFEFVKRSVPSELWEKYNKDGKTAEEIFRDSYKEHITNDRQWLNQTSQTCSVASTLVASMAFTNVAAENFDKKNVSSLLALSLSLTATISFLAILAFRSQSLNFWRYAPFMLQIAILTMFGSIVALWISLMLHGPSLTTYAILGSPIAILTILSLPIFIGPTLMSLFNKVPPPSRNTTSAIYYQRPQKQETATDLNPQRKENATDLNPERKENATDPNPQRKKNATDSNPQK